jgi:hypothetical protein
LPARASTVVASPHTNLQSSVPRKVEGYHSCTTLIELGEIGQLAHGDRALDLFLERRSSLIRRCFDRLSFAKTSAEWQQ